MRYKREIANWWFQNKKPVTSIDSYYFKDLLLAAIQAMSILLDFELLFPERIDFPEYWSKGRLGTTQVRQMSPEPLLIDHTDDLSHIADLIMDHVKNKNADKDAYFPASLQISGYGMRSTGRGKKEKVDDMIVLHMETFNEIVVDIITCSDIWMKYNLRAEPQQYWRKNARILKRALKAIHKKSGYEYIENESDFAEVGGFSLKNLKDSKGDIIAFDEQGNII